MTVNFVHLKVHSEYSLIDSTIRHKTLLSEALKRSIPAIAITDQCNLFGIIKFYKQALAAGIKPIIGVDLLIETDDSELTAITLLAETKEGYQQIVEIISDAYLTAAQRVNGTPIISKSFLLNRNVSGIIALSGGIEGEIGSLITKGHIEKAKDALLSYKKFFGDDCFFIEIQRLGKEGETYYITEALALAHQYNVPVVATNNVRFLNKEDFDIHEVRVGIAEGYTLLDEKRVSRYTSEQYFKSATEMAECFSDIPSALSNTVIIAKRCNVTIKLGDAVLPNFPIPKHLSINEYFKEVSFNGLEARFKTILENHQDADHQSIRLRYETRLQIEIDVICQMGFPGYFLIVADFIQWAKDHDIPVGPGRGSGAGSLVAYALKITDLDPLPYHLLFERFLNPERVSMPDFDIDFCMDGRDRVIDYVAERYGRESVSQIITFGSMAAKAVVRDVGRVLGQPYGFVDKIAKLIPNELGITLKDAYAEGSDLYQFCQDNEEAEQILKYAFKLEGTIRNVGKHAGGVVISPSALTDFSPAYCEAGSKQLVSQFDKKDVEEVGLVKFDFLGLRNLTVIKMAVDLINKRLKKDAKPLIHIETLHLDDTKTFELLKRSETTAIFQLESRGMKELIARLRPDCFEDIIALVALFRPGPLGSGMVDDFINRKHGRQKVSYPHPQLEPVLKETYGTILYQEQVMQIAQVLANYTLGGADLLRRAMGKKNPQEMAKQRDIFINGAKENTIDEKLASSIFDLMEEFAKYGFNKSHSAAYALVSYQTAYLKTHYPAEFMAAVLSSDMDNTDKIVTLINECANMGLTVIPPHINHSQKQFSVDANNHVVYGLCAIKGVGVSAIEMILLEREAHGTYKSIFDFLKRVDLQKVNKRVIEALICAGALDELDTHRASIILSLDSLLKRVEQDKLAESSGQSDLFGFPESNTQEENHNNLYTQCTPFSLKERLKREKSALGLYLSGHLIDEHQLLLKTLNIKPLNHIMQSTTKSSQRLAGVIVSFMQRKTKTGRAFGILTIDDATQRIDITLFSDLFEKTKELIQVDETIIVEGDIEEDNYTGGLRINAKAILTIDQAISQYAKGFAIYLNDQKNHQDIVKIKSLLTDNNHQTTINKLSFHWQDAQISVNWPVNYALSLTQQTIDAVKNINSVEKIELVFN
ncbi:DNA polymerase III subunit alpha [Thiotrichales bacterium 19S3-7]|nr:DNA polymerase III subunit alpha [Thiotrichales bacterium 19S3-7]MCF6802298.1 DNA polymerase III subunit alpha [Thiotrichales bacterium 19S3-11]